MKKKRKQIKENIKTLLYKLKLILTKNYDLQVLEFRKITTQDIFDNKYNDGYSWSRGYEYPLVIETINKYYKPNDSIHNTSWGFEGIHVLFKEELDSLYKNVVHSDIKKSDLKNTFMYDITQPPKNIEQYEVVLNVSTMEEVLFDHVQIFNNLFSMVKPGGVFIATFDIPGLQLFKFKALFNKNLITNGTPITGKESKNSNLTRSHLNCGIMVVKK